VLCGYDDWARWLLNKVLFDLWKVEVDGLLIHDALVLGIFYAANYGQMPGVNPSAEVGVRCESCLVYCKG
jgi:hypothetical protein